VLASSSPRRVDLLGAAGIAFRAVGSGVDERPPHPMSPLAYVAWAAQAKAEAVARRFRASVVVGADTEVVLGRRIFGKPRDREQASEFLRALSGRTHRVYTAVAVIDGRSGCRAAGVSRTRVTMRELPPRVIETYVRTGEAQDKAGAYAIQGRGRRLVAAIDGPYDTVVGMPIGLLRRLLRQCGIPVPTISPDELQHDVPSQSRRRPPQAAHPASRR
jgi:septum formation protein